MTTLEQILATTRATLPALRVRRAALEREAADRPLPAQFLGELGAGMAVVAEVKRRSPSAGAINEALNPTVLARAYVEGGAAAISVLTDGPFFGGSLADLVAVSAVASRPVLRKDFILDDVQLIEARAAGAASALLIVRALEQAELERLLRAARSLGLRPLVEVHTEEEVRRALDAGADVIGVNARDLDTFTVDCQRAWTLFRLLPATVVAVAESGMATVPDVQAAAAAGADAVLIGSALATSSAPAAAVQSFTEVVRRGR